MRKRQMKECEHKFVPASYRLDMYETINKVYVNNETRVLMCCEKCGLLYAKEQSEVKEKDDI